MSMPSNLHAACIRAWNPATGSIGSRSRDGPPEHVGHVALVVVALGLLDAVEELPVHRGAAQGLDAPGELDRPFRVGRRPMPAPRVHEHVPDPGPHRLVHYA